MLHGDQRAGEPADHRDRPRPLRRHHREEGRRLEGDRGAGRGGLRPLPGRRREGAPSRPRPTAPEAGQTWVAQATTGADGLASFPLQYPGYAYCAVETQAPADYVLDTTEHCTPVLEGDAEGPTPVTTLTVSDPEALVTVSAYKFDSATPDTGIPGAVYDLYVEGPGPPSDLPPHRPPGRRPRRATPGGAGAPPTPRAPCRSRSPPATPGASTRASAPTTPNLFADSCDEANDAWFLAKIVRVFWGRVR